MSQGKAQVSPQFAAFLARNQVAVEEAKKAENTMSSGPCPVGWKGQVVLLEAQATVGKDKKDDKGNVVPGNPRVQMKFGIVGDETYQGKNFTKYWSFYKTANATEMDRYEWFLNECEKMGLPRELREKHGSMEELLSFFTDPELVFDCECQSDDYASDKKKMVVLKASEAIDTSSSMMPGQASPQEVVAPVAAATGAAPASHEPGSQVTFLGNKWTVDAVTGDKLVISRTDDTGERRQREVPMTAVTA